MTQSTRPCLFLDTGSADLYIWITNKFWRLEDPLQRYDPTKSLTHVDNNEPAELYYDQCSLGGFISIDDVTVGDVIVKKQSFVEVKEVVECGEGWSRHNST